MAKVMAVEHIWASKGPEANVQLDWRLVPNQNGILLTNLMRWWGAACTLKDAEELLVDVQWVIPSTALDRDIPDLKRVELWPEQWNRWVPDLVIDGPHSALLAEHEVAGSYDAVQLDWRQWAKRSRNLGWIFRIAVDNKQEQWVADCCNSLWLVAIDLNNVIVQCDLLTNLVAAEVDNELVALCISHVQDICRHWGLK